MQLDDIEHTIALLGAAGLEVRISDGTYDYDDLSEFAQKRGIPPRAVYLAASRRDADSEEIEVAFTSDKVILHVADPEQLGTLPHELRDHLSRSKAQLVRTFQPGVWVSLVAIGLFLHASGWKAERDGRDVSAQLGWIGVVLILVSLAVRFVYAGVWLRSRHQGSFFRRNADQVWLAVISALLGAAATKLADSLLGK